MAPSRSFSSHRRSSWFELTTQSDPQRNFRPDIAAARAVAVLLVVAFHMRLPRAQNGFIGVDIFFVLSGYLITGILVAEAARAEDGRPVIDIGRFYTRRIRRLLPASTLVVVTTMLASLILLDTERLVDIGWSGVASTLYGANIFFGVTEGATAASDLDEIPLLHYWSLAVEEQFYIVWPPLIMVLSQVGRRRKAALLGGLGVVGAASLAYSVWAVNAGSAWAYYSTLSRAWEFAAGGLLAIIAPRGWERGSAAARQLLAIGGLAVLGFALLTIDPARFPGLGAIPVVVGTLAVLHAAVTPGSPLGRLIGLQPVQLLGDLSYSLYLWHWPVLVIGQLVLVDSADQVTGEPAQASLTVRIGLIGMSLIASWLSFRFIENPIRHQRRLVADRNANVALALALAAVGVVSGGVLIALGGR